MKKVLIIGGTGILGKPLVMELIKHNEYKIYSIALKKAENPPYPDSVKQYQVDRYSEEYERIINEITSEADYLFDAVIDLIAYDNKSAEQTYSLFKQLAKHIITISTSLVYDRSVKTKEPITEKLSLAKEGQYGGYVDGKLRLEKFWQGKEDTNWTLLRPYHVLGRYSLLGCLPHYNRDPKLIEMIKNNEVIELVNGGNIFLNYIHPKDIATSISKIIGNPKTFKQYYNLINPIPILAKEYYIEIGSQLNKEVKIESISMEKFWAEKKGWEMTTLPHIYSMEKFKADTGFVPETSLSEGIADAIAYPPNYKLPTEQIPVHVHMNKLPRPNKPNWLD